MKLLVRPFVVKLSSFCLIILLCTISAHSFAGKFPKAEVLKQWFDYKKRKEPLAQISLLMSHIDNINELSTSQKILFFNKLAILYLDLAKYEEALIEVQKSIQLYDNAIENKEAYCNSLMTRGFALESLGDKVQAKIDYQQALDVAREINNKEFIAQGLINLGAIAYLADELTESLILLNEALTVAEDLQDPLILGSVNSELGHLHSSLRKLEQAKFFYEKSLFYLNKTGNDSDILNAISNVAAAMAALNDEENSNQQFKELLKKSKALGNVQYQYYAYVGLSGNSEQSGDLELALDYLLKAETIISEVQHVAHKGYFLLQKAGLQTKMKQFDDALVTLARAESDLPEFLNNSHNYNGVYLDNIWGDAYFGSKQISQALKHKKQYVENYVTLREKEWEQNHEEIRIKYVQDRMQAQQQLLAKENILNQLQLSNTEVVLKKQRLQLIAISLALCLLSFFVYQSFKRHAFFRYLARTDELTGITNRGQLMIIGERLWQQAVANKTSLSTFVLDIDHFKLVNDSFGHQKGDEVIKAVASVGAKMMRKSDAFGRVGGEEFVAVLPNTNTPQAMEIAERCRVKVNELLIKHQQIEFSVSVSIGVASLNNGNSSIAFDKLLSFADSALYQAKQAGRNQVVAY